MASSCRLQASGCAGYFLDPVLENISYTAIQINKVRMVSTTTKKLAACSLKLVAPSDHDEPRN
jgi:hypothetical protein